MPPRPSVCKYVIRRAMNKWTSIDCSESVGHQAMALELTETRRMDTSASNTLASMRDP